MRDQSEMAQRWPSAAAPPTAGHTSVSNQLEGSNESSGEYMFEQPSHGGDARAGAVNDDGTEKVKGYRRVQSRDADVSKLFSILENDTLRDIGEASYGAPRPVQESVIGPDDRVKIADTTVYPWRVHASLLITAADNSLHIGTGWFIGPHTLVTAGHCVHIKNSGIAGRDGWVKQISVMPGRNGTTLPFGSVTSTNFRSVTNWTNNGDPNYDYGAIIIPTELGNTTGWFGFGVYPDSELLASAANISGYPGDKPNGTQWYHSRGVSSVNALKVFYDIDTWGGQSGSAVYRTIGNQRFAIAIHAYGVGGTVTSNSGTRITAPVHSNLLAWRA